jgi:glucoamylase
VRPRRLLLSVLLAAIATALPAAALLATALPASARGSEAATAPGAPGATPDWASADKHGFGTSTTLSSNVWFTLEGGELTEVYYPRIDTPSFRDLLVREGPART